MLCLVKAGLAVAVVGGGDDHACVFIIKEAERDCIKHRLPPVALFDLYFARGCRGVGRKIAVFAVADRAYCLFKIARLAVVFAAVVWAGIAALGAFAVYKCVLV